MTAALMTLVNNVELSPTPGISVRACRAVLRCMARLAADDGEFRYGMRQSKVAALAEYRPPQPSEPSAGSSSTASSNELPWAEAAARPAGASGWTGCGPLPRRHQHDPAPSPR